MWMLVYFTRSQRSFNLSSFPSVFFLMFSLHAFHYLFRQLICSLCPLIYSWFPLEYFSLIFHTVIQLWLVPLYNFHLFAEGLTIHPLFCEVQWASLWPLVWTPYQVGRLSPFYLVLFLRVCLILSFRAYSCFLILFDFLCFYESGRTATSPRPKGMALSMVIPCRLYMPVDFG